MFHRPVTAFRITPYFARKSILIPTNFIDISVTRLQEMEQSDDIDDEDREVPIAEGEDEE